MKYFVIQIKRNTEGTYTNNVHTKNDKGEALHQFHAFMSTYGYGQDPNVDYCACYVIDSTGVRYEWKVDDRSPAPEPVESGE